MDGSHISKKPVLSYELFLKYGGEGGIDSLRSPFGQSPRKLVVCPTGCAATQPIPGPRPFGARASSVQKRSRRFCVEPRSVVLIPPWFGDTYKQKARTSVQALNLNMAVRGGFEPPIRCRIHTFQACSFSHSDTSPNCRSSITGTGANVGKYPFYVNQLF